MGLDARKLDRRIRIERATSIDDGMQTRTGPWEALTTVWARYLPGKGSERFEAATRRAEQPVAFTIRWSQLAATISSADRVRYPAADDGRLYEIVAPPTEIGRRDGIELMCVVASDG